MDLQNKTLDNWLKDPPIDRFENQKMIDYYSTYKVISDYLNENVHKHVQSLNMIKDDGYLTDHGPDHIQKVIEKASQLLDGTKLELMAYEVFILLIAIQFHDVGNIFGRKNHAFNSKEIMESATQGGNLDSFENRIIWEIAKAHSSDQGDPNTIGNLQETMPVLDKDIHPQVLAAILRFADELAEDSTRAARFALLKKLLPRKSQIYHIYANSLQAVKVDHKGREIKLHFNLDEVTSTAKYYKQRKKVYLIDEIYVRTIKLYRECLYCMRFLEEHIRINTINVKVEFYKSFNKIHDPIGYKLKQNDYPYFDYKTIGDLCPELRDKNGKLRWSGKTVQAEINKKLSRP